jgi:hypothetical protein
MPLVLRPSKDTEVLLANGQPLHTVDVHLRLVLGTFAPTSIARELDAADLGYLIQVQGEESGPFVHGSAVWTDPQPPIHLLNRALAHTVRLELSNVPVALDWSEAFTWPFGREHIVRIGTMTISSFQPEE